MYEARQNKEKVCRRFDGCGMKRHYMKGCNSNIIQRLRYIYLNTSENIRNDEEKFKQLCRNMVFLCAYLNYNGSILNLGMFTNTNKKHAEENLLDYLKEQMVTEGTLDIYMSTSPCSSTFGTTKEEDRIGCLELLENYLEENKGLEMNIYPDHPYQPKHIMMSKFCSESAMYSSFINFDDSQEVMQLRTL